MKRLWVIWAALAVLACGARLLPGVRTVDDAFITFRYSRNLVEGAGFVYNPPDHVLGTTTPLYTLLMASWGGLLGGNYPNYALVTNALADALGVILLCLITQQVTHRWVIAAWVGLLWAIAPYSVTFAIGGMETSVHNVVMLGAWWAYLTERPRWLGALCALGVLTRPDALLWAVPLLLHQLVYSLKASQEDKAWWTKLPWQTWLAGLVFYLPWMLFAGWYFGSPVPHTVGTKAVVYSVESTQALILFLQHYATPLQGQFTFGRYAIMVGIVLYPALALIGLRANRELRALPLLVYPWIYIAVFVMINPLIFRWYLVPPLPAYFIAIACGVTALLELVPKPTVQGYVLAGIAGLTFIFGLQAWTLHPDHGADRPAPLMAFHELELHYAEMAHLLRDEYGLTDADVLAAGDIGALGFYSRAHIFDTVGLVTPNTAHYYDDQTYLKSLRAEDMNYAIPPDLIVDAQPDFIVVMEGFIRNGLAKDERFKAQYEQIAFIPMDYYGTGMLAFRRIPEVPGE